MTKFLFDLLIILQQTVKLAINRAEDFAAASRQLVSSDYRNTGMAEMSAEITSLEVPTDNLPTIEDSFSNNLTMNAATNFIRNGSVAIIPANTSNIDLISMIQQSQLSFSLTDDEISSIASMTLVVSSENEGSDGSSLTSLKKYVFTVTDPDDIDAVIEEGALYDAEAIAKLLNFGLIRADGFDLVSAGGVENWVADGISYTYKILAVLPQEKAINLPSPSRTINLHKIQKYMQTAKI